MNSETKLLVQVNAMIAVILCKTCEN